VPLDVGRIVRDLRPGSVGMSFELRFYRLLCLATSALLLGVVIPINFFQNTSPWLDLVCSISGVLALVLYLLAVHGVLFKRSYLLLIALLLNIAWFAEGGAEGSIGYFFFVAVVYAVIFFSGVERWTYLVLCALDGLALLAVDFVRPAWSVPFDSRLDRLVTLTTGFVVGVVGLTLMIWLVRSAFDGERRWQGALNRQLAEALELNQQRTAELEALLAEVRTLRGLLPICSHCKSVRDDEGLWTQIERYVSAHSDASFTHSLCPDCVRKLYPDYADAVLGSLKSPG
jgi:hypothetical protein